MWSPPVAGVLDVGVDVGVQGHRVVHGVVGVDVQRVVDQGVVGAVVDDTGIVDDHDPAAAAAGAAVGVAAAEQAAAGDRAAAVAAAGVDVVEDGAVVVGDDVVAGGLGIVLDVVVVTDDDRRVVTGLDVDLGVVVPDDVVVAGDVLVADHDVLADDVLVPDHVAVAGGDGSGVVTVDDHAAVGGGVGGLVAEGDIAEAEVEPADLGVGARALIRAEELRVGPVVAGDVGLRGEGALRGVHRGERRRDAVVVGDRALQAEHRIAAAEGEPGRGRGGGDGLQLSGGDVGQAGVTHGLFRVGDERSGQVGAAEQVEDVVDDGGHWSAFRWVVRRTEDHVMSVAIPLKRGRIPSSDNPVPGSRGSPL